MENRPTSFNDIPLVLSVEEPMPILHVGRNTVYELVRSNQIRGIKVGKQIRVLKPENEKYYLRGWLIRLGFAGTDGKEVRRPCWRG